jgi:hypothetical protein
MRINNAFSYMMERRAGSSKDAAPPRYDAEDCHEYVSLDDLQSLHLLTFLRVEIQGIHKGYSNCGRAKKFLIYMHIF